MVQDEQAIVSNPRRLRSALVNFSKEDAVKNLVMQYRIKRAARYRLTQLASGAEIPLLRKSLHMSYFADLEVGHWFIIGGCIAIIVGSVGLGMKKSN
ncbi:hypothetical protein L6654_42640 [Bradyrhizobium sp. WYCCWR 13023]|uniref:Uncharacterized protein n=1 Tax=Bradyrhizobium zhengyangense TaxID=2911009 RepID=A0A9X1RI80_9BRAD|nr:hypothetical protein [Bradyrhizobium zhengyangense]MCG2633214.1 hypothetical protein [Bradyrhizobium zhengyangense]